MSKPLELLCNHSTLLVVLPQPQGPGLTAGTFSHLLEVFEDAKVMGQVGGQDDVPHQVQHTLIVLGRGGGSVKASCQTPPPTLSAPTPDPITFREKWSKMLQPWVLRMAMA